MNRYGRLSESKFYQIRTIWAAANRRTHSLPLELIKILPDSGCNVKKILYSFSALILASSALQVAAHADIVVSGSATFTLDEGLADSLDNFDALFDGTTSRSDCLSLPSPGNVPFTTISEATVQYSDPIRPNGVVPSGYPGSPGASRSPQITNLNFNPSNILGSWAPSTDSYGDFVSLGSSGQQIAFTLMQRWTSSTFTGSLLYGDFGLRYAADRVGEIENGETLSGLVLTSNIDFLNASWSDLGDATITDIDGTLGISGDLLISGAVNVLDPTATVGEKFGTFNLTATTAVPEPSALGLLAMAGGASFLFLRKRKSVTVA